MRWLFHIVRAEDALRDPIGAADLARDGFVHCSYRDRVVESAALYFAGVAVKVLQLDPRRLAARIDVAATPRGPMPHVHGDIPRAAVVAVLDLDELAGAPDRIV
jgi:uncharacterized protein (DUF952 family)